MQDGRQPSGGGQLQLAFAVLPLDGRSGDTRAMMVFQSEFPYGHEASGGEQSVQFGKSRVETRAALMATEGIQPRCNMDERWELFSKNHGRPRIGDTGAYADHRRQAHILRGFDHGRKVRDKPLVGEVAVAVYGHGRMVPGSGPDANPGQPTITQIPDNAEPLLWYH
jgi:hypothetical protein